MAERSAESNLRSLIESYFHQGYDNRVILDFLKSRGIEISLATLKRRLQDYGLRRNNVEIEEETLKRIIREEMAGPGELRGYRAIWHSLKLNHHVHVPRHKVAEIIRELNPAATQRRQSRRLTRRTYTSYGPNFCWHADGYDKLKPFGFPVHGAIDGYSRKILWLKVARSNNNPQVVAGFYLDCVSENSGCPILIRTDCGTENGILAAMQSYFRQDGTDQFSGEKSHRYGSSPQNQRIECWWSFFRRGRSSWWIDLFSGLVESGLLDLGNELHKECLWFCYNGVLQDDLNHVKNHWNTHRIRRSRYGTIPGVPDVLYSLPQRAGAYDCKVPVPNAKLHEMELHLEEHSEGENSCNIFQEYFHYVMETENLLYPRNYEDAFGLFQKLITTAMAC